MFKLISITPHIFQFLRPNGPNWGEEVKGGSYFYYKAEVAVCLLSILSQLSNKAGNLRSLQ